MVLGWEVSLAQVVGMFLEDCYQTVPVYNLIHVQMVEIDLVAWIKLRNELFAIKISSLCKKLRVLWLDGDQDL